jgi:hypothetical protein
MAMQAYSKDKSPFTIIPWVSDSNYFYIYPWFMRENTIHINDELVEPNYLVCGSDRQLSVSFSKGKSEEWILEPINRPRTEVEPEPWPLPREYRELLGERSRALDILGKNMNSSMKERGGLANFLPHYECGIFSLFIYDDAENDSRSLSDWMVCENERVSLIYKLTPEARIEIAEVLRSSTGFSAQLFFPKNPGDPRYKAKIILAMKSTRVTSYCPTGRSLRPPMRIAAIFLTMSLGESRYI